MGHYQQIWNLIHEHEIRRKPLTYCHIHLLSSDLYSYNIKIDSYNEYSSTFHPFLHYNYLPCLKSLFPQFHFFYFYSSTNYTLIPSYTRNISYLKCKVIFVFLFFNILLIYSYHSFSLLNYTNFANNNHQLWYQYFSSTEFPIYNTLFSISHINSWFNPSPLSFINSYTNKNKTAQNSRV